MSLADALKATYRDCRPLCGIAVILDGLDSKDRADLTAALADPDVKSAHLTRALQHLFALEQVAAEVKGDTVARHRRGECSCGHR